MAGKSFRMNPDFTGSQTSTVRMGEWVDSEGRALDEGTGSGGNPVEGKVVPWFDRALPVECPEYKREWTHSWKVHVDKTTKEIDLNNLPLIKKFISALKGSKEFQDAEIHALWVSHIPQNVTQEQISVQLEFTKALDMAKRTMAACRFPGYLYTHMIFYPGHSIELHGSPIPWAIKLDTSRIPVAADYRIGDLYLMLCGNETSISHMEEERPAVMISMAPLTQRISGVALTAPRRPSSKMIQTYARRGVNSASRATKIIKLMEAGIDVEGLGLLGKLDIALEMIPEDILNTHGDPKSSKVIAEKVSQAAKSRKKVKFGL
ncbi:TPA_asm: protein 3 [Pinus flexilis virus 1]|uniref:Protein 3 n=1 Tax=Pinus flexilis virus 1 TaxID=2793737 RepID=A0A8D9PGT6_9RHAB|nr:protein 3 [Pinus flexilis virus 1]DAF42371.1 TPA_asm: protein 3 [Pinus flexilis virus 1]